jgi:hypothetical protein
LAKRKIHLRNSGVINLGKTKTHCGRVIYTAPDDTSGAVVLFNHDIDVTVHAVLVTCSTCLKNAH